MLTGDLIGGWIAPHGVVSDMPGDRLARVPQTDAAMASAAARIVALKPDTIIVVTPHGFRAPDYHTVSLCPRNSVDLSAWYPWTSGELTAAGDPELALHILQAARSMDLPTVGLIYGATSDAAYPMDWAITAPLRYLQEAGYTGRLLPVTFAGASFEAEWHFGEAIFRAVIASGRRAALVASSDLSHVHSPDGPYGYDPIAPEFDRTIESAVQAGELSTLIGLDPAWVDRAAQDGLRSILILGGTLATHPFKAEVLAYEVLVYFGMLTAVFLER